MVMLLKVEGKRPEHVREFTTVEMALRGLDRSGPHSYASLTRQDGSYVQVAGGKQDCVVERRDVLDGTHWRACHAEMASRSATPLILNFGGGRMTIAAEEVFGVDDVISLWRAFFHAEPFALNIDWRDMTELFGQ